MRVLVCIKRVPAPGARIAVTDDGLEVDTRNLGFAMSPHEECAVEEAVQLVEQHGGETTVLTLGPAEAEEQLRYAVSLGVNHAVLAVREGRDWDPMATAAAITDAVQGLEQAGGEFDLILFGNESADSGGYQVGIRVAHALGRPCVSAIKGIEIDGQDVTALRETDAGAEMYRVQTPAVLAVKEGINLPRYPTLKGRLGAKKHPVERLDPVHTAGGQQLIRLTSPPVQVSHTEILGEGAEAAPKVAALMQELGLIS